MGNHFLLQGQGADSIPVGKGLLGTGCVPMLCQVGGGGERWKRGIGPPQRQGQVLEQPVWGRPKWEGSEAGGPQK